MRGLGFLLLACGFAACSDVDVALKQYCAAHPTQPGCEGTDAGAIDDGRADAGLVDAGVMDAGVMDAGAQDAGADAGASDAGAEVDAGVPDAGPFDAGPLVTTWDVHLASIHGCARRLSNGEVLCWGEPILFSVIPNTSQPVTLNLQVASRLVTGSLATCVESTPGSWDCQKPLQTAPTGSAGSIAFGGMGSQNSGYEFGCAVRDAGSLDCWGNNSASQLASFDAGVVQVSAGFGSSFLGCVTPGRSACALFDDGGVSCWGDNAFGKVDPSASSGAFLSPVHRDLPPAREVVVGGSAACTREAAGEVRCWGAWGDGGVVMRDVESVSLGGCHACALLFDAGVRCWGQSSGGQLGTDAGGVVVDSAAALAPDLNGAASSVASGGNMSCVTARNGSVWCWGAVRSVSGSSPPQQVLP